MCVSTYNSNLIINEYFVKVGSSLANNIKSHTDPIMHVTLTYATGLCKFIT